MLEPSTTRALRTQNSMGGVETSKTKADVLLGKVDFTPLCQLRGLDIFVTETSEPEMLTHPYLLQNGLRHVPTLMLNIMTAWGHMLVYFELPAWLTDTTTSLVEQESDTEDVKALKVCHFLF